MRLMLLSVLTSLIGFAQQPVPQPSTCAADGFVVNAVTGEPIPRARVLVVGPTQSGTVAEGAGRWQISGIPCGRLSFTAFKPGFLSHGQGAVMSPDSPAHDVRIELTPQSVITGKVIDETGDPVQNAQILVMASRVVLGKRTFQQAGGGNTNDLGEFRVANLSAAKIILCARPPVDVQSTEALVSADSCYPGPVEGGSASAMSLPAGREVRVDFTLSKVPAVHVRGKVAGLPEGAGLSLMLQPRNGGPGRPAALRRDGEFEVRAVPPGNWMLSVDYWEGGKRLMARVPLDVAGSDVEGVVVHLEPGFSVSGTLRVESQSGRTAPPLNLNLRSTDARSGAGAVQWDKDHKAFTINDVIPDTYSLNVNVQAPFYLKSATLGGRDISRDALPIMQAPGPIEVVIADDGGSVQGQIEDANGEPAAGWVMLSRDGNSPVAVQSTPDGRFKFGGLAPGDYRAYAWDDYTLVEYADPEWMRRNAGGGQSVSVTAGQSADVKLIRVVVPRD